MERQPRNSGRRIEILALIEGRHSSPKEFQRRWTSAAVAHFCGVARATAHHILARLIKNGLVELERAGGAEFRRQLKGGGVLVGRMPGRTAIWSVTDKGKKRVEYFGGHEKWCPICRE